MRKLRAFLLRFFGSRRARLEVDAELQSHIDLHIEDGVRSGVTYTKGLSNLD
jgi:hypothetical protein